VRKLLPDSWGFMCPVHTPDGSPCGLLLHLTAACRVATAPPGEAESVQAAIAMARAPAALAWRQGAASSGRAAGWSDRSLSRTRVCLHAPRRARCAAGVWHSRRDAPRRAAWHVCCVLQPPASPQPGAWAADADTRPCAGRQVAAGLGMLPGAPGSGTAPPWPAYLCVQLDGRCIGWVHARRAAGLVARLRACKAARLAAEEGPQPGVQYADITSAVCAPASTVPAPAETCNDAQQCRLSCAKWAGSLFGMPARTAALQVPAARRAVR